MFGAMMINRMSNPCEKCSSPLKPGARFCGKCGTALSNDATGTRQSLSQAASSTSAPSSLTAQSNNGATVKFTKIALVTVAILVAAGIGLSSAKHSTPNYSPAASDYGPTSVPGAPGGAVYPQQRAKANQTLFALLTLPSFTLAQVQTVVSSGADVNATTTGGLTVLMCASRNLDCVKYLVAYGADVNVKDDTGLTALLNAAEDGESNTVEYLVSSNADVNAIDRNGRGALMYASQAGKLDCVQFLIAKGLDVNIKDVLGETPLMAATEMDHADVVKYLISQGADVNAKQTSGMTALAMARGHQGVITALRAAGAKH